MRNTIFRTKYCLIVIAILSLFSFTYCNNSTAEIATKQIIDTNRVPIKQVETEEVIIKRVEDREEIKQRLQEKIKDSLPLVIHIFVPLCDNDNQGIVPTSKSLGDGLNLRTNLYWATGSATKKFFQNHSKWKMVYNKFDVDSNILERVVFSRNYPNSKVYIVADAYRGDRMEQTINDFLASLSVNRLEKIYVDSIELGISAYSDLLIFNGHNGMMDNLNIKEWKNSTEKRTDAVINACLTYDYFSRELINAGAYPLMRSKSLLHPGAYVLTQVIDDWVKGETATDICLNAGAAYCRKQKCKGGTKIYTSGW